MKCGKFYDARYVKESAGVPRCTCGGLIKPDVVLYEEGLDPETIQGAVQAIGRADTLIIGGTSLVVYPAAGFIDYFRGENLILINRDDTPLDASCTLVVHGKVGETLGALPSYTEETL